MRALTLAVVVAGTGAPVPTRADPPVRRPDASLTTIARGPFRSARLFDMPIADVVGAYQMSVSGDGSLLQATGLLSSAGVLAIGFGDLAQLEYRHTAAIGIGRTAAPVPAIGVQLRVPLPEGAWIPGLAVAFRLGVPRGEELDGAQVDETVTDLYLVSRLGLGPLTVHGGARVSTAAIALDGPMPVERRRTLVLPAAGWEVALRPESRIVGELAAVPRFDVVTRDGVVAPTIGHGVLGRVGVRWRALPALSIDGSVGYQLEVAGPQPRDGAGAMVAWDIRLGGELFVPWGALVCRAVGVFCE
jgi:hypothetical protein